jgi:nitrous oxidase accessory protein NosD
MPALVLGCVGFVLLGGLVAAEPTPSGLRDLDAGVRDGGTVPGPQAPGVVTLPAGSVNALADAIAQAGDGGVVLVESGMHIEESPVVIETRVSIIGEPGSVLEIGTAPLGAALPAPVDGALHVLNADHVVIHGIELAPLGEGPGNTAILIENSTAANVESNFIHDWDLGVVVQKGDHVDISFNEIVATTYFAVMVINGRFAHVTDNQISGATFGIWACDLNGHAKRNTTTDSFIGIILCRVPPEYLISGEVVGSEDSATQWHVQTNTSMNNFWGYAITDGSHDNVLANNAASNNFIDIEVLGDSEFFGFFTPTAFDNIIAVGSESGIGVHDCGVNTSVNGNATFLDLECF